MLKMLDIVYEIVKYVSSENTHIRSLSKMFMTAFDRLHSHKWRHDKICANIQHRMNIEIDINQVAGKPIQDWVFDTAKPYEYCYLVHSAAMIKRSYTMKDILVKCDDINALDSFDLGRVDWKNMAHKLQVNMLYKFADYIEDWDNIVAPPSADLIEKCHNASMFKYISNFMDVYPKLTKDVVNRLGDILDWSKVVSRAHKDAWIEHANTLEWRNLSNRLFVNKDNCEYIDWSIYSVCGLTDEDFINYGNRIWTDCIESVCLRDTKLIYRHIRLYGDASRVYNILVNDQFVSIDVL